MASLTLSPTLTMLQKNSDGSYDFTVAMVDVNGKNYGFRTIHLATDGSTTVNGVATGVNLTAAQMTTLNNNWATYQTGINNMDTAGKLPF